MPLIRLLILVVLSVCVTPESARAQNCSATMTDLVFGTITLRSGVTNETSGNLSITCAGFVNVGVCVYFGEGGGGAGAGLSPRFMRRADNAALDFQLRRSGNGGTDIWDGEHFTLNNALLGRTINVPVYADIESSGFGVGPGSYSSTFSGNANARIEFNTNSCAQPGTVRSVNAFTVSADVAASCEVDAATLDFGVLGASLPAPVDAVTEIIVRCSDGAPYSVRLDNGVGSGASGPTDRRMEAGASQLVYGLYRDAARTQPWGDQAGNSVSGTGAAVDQGIDVYGRIFAGQPLNAGSYSDSVLITVEY